MWKKRGRFSEDFFYLFFIYLFFRDHTNPMRKKGEILVKTFFRDHSGRFFLPLQTVLLSNGYENLHVLYFTSVPSLIYKL